MFFTRLRVLPLILLLACLAGRAAASIPRYDDIMPISEIRPGMKGYGLTVFRGTKIERFDVTVVDVVKKGSLIVPGHDMILVKMSGGPMTERQANLIRGMSGSPVYINGKIIGAFSQGEPTTKEPLGGVTPIEDMLEAWDPKLSDSPLSALPDNRIRTAQLPRPLQIGSRRIQKIIYNAPLKSGLRSHGTTLVMHPCTTVVTISGMSRTALAKLQQALEPYNVEVALGGGASQQRSDFPGAPLVPGAAFSMMLVTGDISVGATGTISYRRENRILGFGHPFLGIGAIEAPLCSAFVYDVYPLIAGSYKISSPGPIVGTSSQDRNFSISGYIGKMPRLIPITVDVSDQTTGRKRTFKMQSVAHPNLYAALVSLSVSSAIAEIRSTPGPTMARVETSVEAEELGTITRTNEVYDARAIDSAATADLDEMLNILTGNPFYPLGIKSANVKVVMESGHRTAQIERIFVKEGRFEPGEAAEIGVVIKPWKQPSITKTLKITIPQNAQNGRLVLMVRGGAPPPALSIGGFILRQQPQQTEQAPPANIRQMMNRLLEREKNTEIVARLLLPTTTVNVDGEKLSNLPPSLDAIMRSAKSSGVRMDRDEVRVTEPTDWVIYGQQVLTLNVQRRDVQETPSGGPSSGGPGSAPPSAPSGGGSSFDSDFSQGDDVEDRTNAFGQQGGLTLKRAGEPLIPQKNDARGGKSGDQGKPGAPVDFTAPSSSSPRPSSGSEMPIVRQPQVWRQSSRADFEKGDARGICVTTKGELCLTRTLKRLQTSSESFVWSLIPDGKGGLFAGTGTQGRIFHLDPDGKIREFVRLPEVSVHSLLRTPDGVLWAATGPNGRTYRIAPDGRYYVAHQAAEKYALALARDSRGNIYLGTGGGAGNIYRVAPDGSASVYLRTSEEHVQALAIDQNDTLYAGTSSAGIIYRIGADGKATVLYDAQEQSITALGVNNRGYIYATTAPRGVLYRIAPDGSALQVYSRNQSAFTTLCVGPSDTVYVAGGSGVYVAYPDDTIVSLDNQTDVDILSLSVGEDGTVFAGTGNVAEIYAALPTGAQQRGTYESVVHDAKQIARWGAIRWTANVPAGTTLRVETRTGNVAIPDSTWSEWSPPAPQSEGLRISSPPGRFIQYRITLTSDSPTASPSVRDVALTYLPRNQPPRVVFQAPSGGERWARQQTIRWEASDPDRDTLSYELFYSDDNGATWKPLPGAAAPAPAPPSAPAPTPPTSAPLQPRLATEEEVRAELDKNPGVPPALREEILARVRQQNQRSEAAATPSSAPSASPSASLREPSRPLDTKSLPDGVYRLKIVATDRPSNAVDSTSVETISAPFVICNTPPVIYLLKATMRVNPDRSVTLEGAALQKTIAITAVQYRVDNGEWQAAAATDGIYDSDMESFALTTAPLPPGTHTIEVKAFNAANNMSVEKMSVEVK